MKTIKVKEIMTCKPEIIEPNQTIVEAARRMKKVDCGILPVGSSDKVVGMITDRDIAIRAIAEGKEPSKTLVQDVMTRKVYNCSEDDDIEDAAEKMRDNKVARLVVSDGKKVTGIVTMGELLRAHGDRHKGDKVLHQLVKPQISGSARAKAAGGCCD